MMTLKAVLVMLLLFLVELAHAQTPDGQNVQTLPFPIAGGEVLMLPVVEGEPLRVDNSKIKIDIVELVYRPEIPGSEKQSVSWIFNFTEKTKGKIDKVTVEEVAVGNAVVPVLQDSKPALIFGSWQGQSPAIASAPQSLPWLYAPGPSTFIFKFTIKIHGQPELVLYQAKVISHREKAKIVEQTDLTLAHAQQVESAKPFEVAPCAEQSLPAYSPDGDAVTAHRQFAKPIINYPFDTKPFGRWGFEVSLKVDELGRVVCYALVDQYGEVKYLNDQRRAALKEIAAHGYAPFLQDGKAMPAMITESLREQELSEQHLRLPEVPLDKVHLSLERTECFGSCPAYKIDIYGDGTVIYQGNRYVDVMGTHRYKVPPEDVAHLVESIRQKDLWSLRTGYQAAVTDNPFHMLMIDMGGKVHHITDYVGAWDGMPVAVSAFELEMDQTARSDMWMHVSAVTVEHLKAEHFHFHSKAGAKLLGRAIADDETTDDDALLALIALGAPIENAVLYGEFSDEAYGSLIGVALRRNRSKIIDPMIASGILSTNHHADQKKIDSAFRAAIQGGHLDVVQKIWRLRGSQAHPSLTFDSVAERVKPVHKAAPVTLLLKRPLKEGDRWDAIDITKFLIAQGCDINAAGANKDTLLHIAAEAGDADFVRYLLSQGMDPLRLGNYDLPALAGVHTEDVAMLLLEAGADTAGLETADFSFRRHAESNHWQHVSAWLEAHRH